MKLNTAHPFAKPHATSQDTIKPEINIILFLLLVLADTDHSCSLKVLLNIPKHIKSYLGSEALSSVYRVAVYRLSCCTVPGLALLKLLVIL